MQDPAQRTRKIFYYSLFVVICLLALLFIFIYISTRCSSRLLFGEFGTSDCTIGVSVFWLEGAFLGVALLSLYRVNRLMQGGG